MKLPYPKFLDNISITVKLTNGLDVNGAPSITLTVSTKGTFNEGTLKRIDAEGKGTELSGKVIINGDIAPSIKSLEGYVDVNSREYIIHKGIRTRNPDGSIHHTELELV